MRALGPGHDLPAHMAFHIDTYFIIISQLKDFKTLVVSIPKHSLGYIMLIQLEENISEIFWTLVLDRDIAAVVLANARERPLFI